ncbi:gamma-secretase subunit PEN [Acrasis kona]|uniref:Gamma-secretase subunit PEN n=1 Tax=Acrasis kona TaxID=1008807 RepID=A0AAW2ZAY6_9EUKA
MQQHMDVHYQTPYYNASNMNYTQNTQTQQNQYHTPPTLIYPASPVEDQPILQSVDQKELYMTLIAEKDAEKAKHLFIIGFFLPFIWLVNLRFRNSANPMARSWWRRSLVCFVVFVSIVTFTVIVVLSALNKKLARK